MIGITTAGDNINSFGHGQMEYAAKVATGVVKDDSFFAFVARADQDQKGNVEYTDPVQHQKANPSYGVTVSPEELMQDALQAQNDPQKRKNFLARSLNIYTASMRSYFDIEEFRDYLEDIDDIEEAKQWLEEHGAEPHKGE
jgi:phage terminase large subunit-like protein